jgi:hypothetical protein
MSGHDELTAATDQVTAPEEHSGVSRRAVLRTAAGAGIAATALAATGMPALAATAGRMRPRQAASAGHEVAGHAAGGEPIVAHLRNARTGEIDVFHGTSQTRLHDHALAAALIRASK